MHPLNWLVLTLVQVPLDNGLGPRSFGRLVDAGADVEASNRRGAQALHYAVDGGPGSPRWAPSHSGPR